MIYLASLIIGFACLQCLIAGVNACYRLPKKDSEVVVDEPLLSVLIPARNEAANIPLLLQDLQQQNYRYLEILVFDDLSTDNEEIATSEVTVIALQGAVRVANAEGKKVVITNILGQTVANTVITSSDATIAAPQGVVVVAVEGEEAVKAIVK
jgi:cellulose synthase/poly-beta-1,6-N-acetylglucosamine synthase-like glycosyltransferase